MNYFTDRFEIIIFKIARYLIRRGYGADCKTSDLDDFPEMQIHLGKDIQNRCASCKAKEIINWIDGHIELLRN